MVGGGEGALGLADALDDVGRDVVAQLLIDQRGAGGEGGRRRGDHGQGLVVDLDEVARVLGEGARLGHHGRDHLADVADLLDGQRVAHAVADGGAGHRARHARRPRLLDVGDVLGRHHGQHAGQRQRGGGVDAPHAGVRVGAPHHGGVRDARHLEVVDERAAPGEQARVFPPRDRRADVAAFGRALRREGAGAVMGVGFAGDQGQHRVDHALVAGAATQVSGQRVADLGLGGPRVVAERGGQRHEDAAGAEAALDAVVPDELGLKRIEVLGIRRQALDGLDASAVGLDGQQQAAPDGLAVHQHGAGAADAVLAADVGAGQSKRVAKEIDQRGARLHRGPAGLAVHDERDVARLGHAASAAADSSAAARARVVKTPARRLR